MQSKNIHECSYKYTIDHSHYGKDIIMTKPKFNIGDTVYNKVEKKGSFEPSTCNKYTKLTINSISTNNHATTYTCGYDGYMFKESELMSPDEYKVTL